MLIDKLPEDKSFIIEKDQLENIRLIYNYTQDPESKVFVDYRDKFPRQIIKDSPVFFYSNEIYKYDIKQDIRSIEGHNIFNVGGAQFIVDSEKITIRPFYPTEDFSIKQRDNLLPNWIGYLTRIKKEFRQE